MASPEKGTSRLRYSLRGLWKAVTALCVVLAIGTAAYRWHAVRSRQQQAQYDLYDYGGVFTMASAAHSRRTGGPPKSWFFVTFQNYVESVDLSPHNWSAVERRGKVLAVDDAALALLRGFPELRSLDLRDTRVTDRSVRRLMALSGLQRLDLRGARITDQGERELREALPDCEILR